jgi:hypothetical protein
MTEEARGVIIAIAFRGGKFFLKRGRHMQVKTDLEKKGLELLDSGLN